MKTLKISLLADNTIFVGEVTKKADLLHTFYVKKIEKLDEFISTNKVPYKYFYKAFGYWILCNLQRSKENKNRYGILTRKLINFSKKLWKRIRSLARRIAKEIQLFQQNQEFVHMQKELHEFRKVKDTQ